MIARTDIHEIYRPLRTDPGSFTSDLWSPRRRWYLPCKVVVDFVVGVGLLRRVRARDACWARCW